MGCVLRWREESAELARFTRDINAAEGVVKVFRCCARLCCACETAEHLAPRMASERTCPTWGVRRSLTPIPGNAYVGITAGNGNGPIKIRNRAATAKLSTSLTSVGIRDRRRIGETAVPAMLSLIDAPLISGRSVPINMNSRWISREFESKRVSRVITVACNFLNANACRSAVFCFELYCRTFMENNNFLSI